MPTQMEKYFPNDVLYEHGKYSTAYLFSTESPHIFSNIDVRGKNVLAVASGGGDTALYALDAGAKSVELFDISRHALLAVELKYAAFRNLPLSEFKEMFDINLNEPSIDFDWGIYEYKLRPELSKESLECMKFVEEHQSYLFDSRFAKRRYRFYETPYLQDPETYERYKKLAQRTPESKLLDIRADKPFAE
ncbi:MAG: BtaA family protein, partial [Alphaproteobacteria bacterium]|nr:BtaA family protein [Alphaproteobacteria bacterium]